MKRTLTQLKTRFGQLTGDTSSANTSLGADLMNDALGEIYAIGAWSFLEITRTATTTASTQFYDEPNDMDKLLSVTVLNGTTTYTPQEASNRKQWDHINSSSSIESDIPEWFFRWNGQVGFYPTPSTTVADAISFHIRRTTSELTVEDYSTGTVDIITAASTAVTGASTVWSASMAGRWIRTTKSDTASAAGDGEWYEIASVATTTTLTLEKAYGGTSLTTGASASYLMGEVSRLPDNFQQLPLYYALDEYFTNIHIDPVRASRNKFKYDEGLAKLKAGYLNKTLDPTMHFTDDIEEINPNLRIRSVG